MVQPIKIIIADDHQLFADGVEQILSNNNQFEVIAKINNGKLLLQTLNRLSPQLVLMDINMPFLTGLEAAQIIKKDLPNIKIILLSMYYDNKMISMAKQYGVDGYLLKNTTAPDLKEAIINVMQGLTVYLLPNQFERQTAEKPEDDFTKKHKLSQREIEIIKLIKQGKSTKEIANEIFLSNFTVETHRKNIYKKLKIISVGQLISFAAEHNL